MAPRLLARLRTLTIDLSHPLVAMWAAPDRSALLVMFGRLATLLSNHASELRTLCIATSMHWTKWSVLSSPELAVASIHRILSAEEADDAEGDEAALRGENVECLRAELVQMLEPTMRAVKERHGKAGSVSVQIYLVQPGDLCGYRFKMVRVELVEGSEGGLRWVYGREGSWELS